jgi:hypothetical protein
MNSEIRKIFNIQNMDDFNNIDLNRVKQIWASFVMSHKKQILDELQEDINDFALSINDKYESNRDIFYYKRSENLKTLFFIKKQIVSYSVEEDLKDIDTNIDVIRFWPTLFLPVPQFVEELY